MNQKTTGIKLFYDTYALYAIALGKESYRIYVKDHKIFTSLMNLYELYYTLLKEDRKDLAEEFFNRLQGNCIDIKGSTIKKASELRMKEIKRKMSYIDCLGYSLAKENEMKFLTGDKEFEKFEDVMFVKA